MFRTILIAGVALAFAAPASAYMRDKGGNESRAAVEHLQKGSEAMEAKDYETAVKEFTKGIEIGGLNKDNEKAAHLNRGIAYFQLKNCPSAIPDFDKALEVGGDDALAYIQRAQCKFEGGQAAAGAADAKKAVEMTPEDGTYAKVYCALSFNAKLYADAGPACETVVVKFEPQNAQLTQASAQSYDAAGNKAKAKEMWTKLLALDPSSEAAKQGIARNS